MIWDIVSMIQDGAIDMDDLEEFSYDLKVTVGHLAGKRVNVKQE